MSRRIPSRRASTASAFARTPGVGLGQPARERFDHRLQFWGLDGEPRDFLQNFVPLALARGLTLEEAPLGARNPAEPLHERPPLAADLSGLARLGRVAH